MSSAYVPGIENVEADEESRRMNLDVEWQINPELLKQSFQIPDFEPDIDLLASRISPSAQNM